VNGLLLTETALTARRLIDAIPATVGNVSGYVIAIFHP